MNGNSGLVKFLLFLFLAVMILLQILSMVQANRLSDRLDGLIDRLSIYKVTSQSHPGGSTGKNEFTKQNTKLEIVEVPQF